MTASTQAFLRPLLGVLFITLVTGCYFRVFQTSFSRHLREAEELTRQGKYQAAIDEYRKHIEKRLQTKNRPEWENPFFYEILIGDLHLRAEDHQLALEAYESAEKHGVEAGLVSDRYRLVASWLEERENYETALEVLRRYRDRDPMLFDLVLDRIARKLVEIEETSGTSHGGLSSEKTKDTSNESTADPSSH